MMIVPSLPQQRYAVTFCHSLFLLSILGTWKAISVANQIHDRYTLDITQQPCNECQKIITATFLLYILVLPQAFSPPHHPLGRAGGRSDQRTEENYKQISVVFFFFLRSHLKGLTLSLSLFLGAAAEAEVEERIWSFPDTGSSFQKGKKAKKNLQGISSVCC